MDDLVGEQLGSFQILALLGRGAMARVYRASQASPQREVALKVIRRVPGDPAEMAARFQREKTILQKLDHPNIMPIYDYAANSDYLWIASRLIRGGTLEDRIREARLPLVEVVRVASHVAGAIDLAEKKGVVHRDIKPANIMIDPQEDGDRYILSDFGVAKLLQAEGLTAPGTTLGTPEYMSPEQVRGHELTAASDQYSLGILVYQLLTGKVPFSGKPVPVMQMHAQTSPPAMGAGLPPGVEKVVFQALAKDPSKRFPNATQFAEALQAAVGISAVLPASEAVVEDLPEGGTMLAQTLGAGEVPELPEGGTIAAFTLGEVEDLPPGGTVAMGALPPDLEEPETPRKRPLALLLGIPVLAMIGLGVVASLSRRAVPPPPAVHYCLSSGKGNCELQGPQGSLGAATALRPYPGGQAVLATASEVRGKQDLYRVDLASGTRTNLTKLGLPEIYGCVSADGKTLLYTDKKLQLVRKALPDGAPAPLSLGKRCSWPSLSPDGQTVAFSSEGKGKTEICVSPLKGAKKRVLSHPAAGEVDVCPAWSPDGQRLVFERQGKGTQRLLLLSLDGHEEALADGSQPCWSPSPQIAFVTARGVEGLTPGAPPSQVRQKGEDPPLTPPLNRGTQQVLVPVQGQKTPLWPVWP